LDAVGELQTKIEAGENLRPFLSDRIDRFGYVRPQIPRNNKPPGVEWQDKDYALNASETHHLHLAVQRHGLSTAFQAGDQMVIGGFLTRAGTSPLHNMHVADVLRCIRSTDPQLDAPGFGRERFEREGRNYPTAPAFEWMIRYCDLVLVETSSSIGFIEVPWRR